MVIIHDSLYFTPLHQPPSLTLSHLLSFHFSLQSNQPHLFHKRLVSPFALMNLIPQSNFPPWEQWELYEQGNKPASVITRNGGGQTDCCKGKHDTKITADNHGYRWDLTWLYKVPPLYDWGKTLKHTSVMINT